jgi:hypothetical protein
MKPSTYNVFISYRRKTGGDFASYLKDGLDTDGMRAFLDIEDIPKKFKGSEEWWKFRDKALVNSEVFLLIITDGIETSPEVSKEISLANKNKLDCLYFRHKGLKPHIIVNLENVKFDLGDFEQTEFETKEDLLRKTLRHLGTQKATSGLATSIGKIAYCRRCGALAGQKSVCIGFNTAHDFVTGSGTIYCRRCGVVVGERSECIGVSTAHDFVTGSSATFCRRCGVLVGKRSVCTGLNTAHDFVST